MNQQKRKQIKHLTIVVVSFTIVFAGYKSIAEKIEEPLDIHKTNTYKARQINSKLTGEDFRQIVTQATETDTPDITSVAKEYDLKRNHSLKIPENQELIVSQDNEENQFNLSKDIGPSIFENQENSMPAPTVKEPIIKQAENSKLITDTVHESTKKIQQPSSSDRNVNQENDYISDTNSKGTQQPKETDKDENQERQGNYNISDTKKEDKNSKSTKGTQQSEIITDKDEKQEKQDEDISDTKKETNPKFTEDPQQDLKKLTDINNIDESKQEALNMNKDDNKQDKNTNRENIDNNKPSLGRKEDIEEIKNDQHDPECALPFAETDTTNIK